MASRPQNIGIKAIELYFPSQASSRPPATPLPLSCGCFLRSPDPV